MYHSANSTVSSAPQSPGEFNVICDGMAMAMIGRTVDLLVDARTIAHGIVAGVLTEEGMPKLVVGGTRYKLSQILAVTPTSLN